MKFKKLLGLSLFVAVLMSSPVMAAERGTREEAMAMAEKAAALVKAEGDRAFSKFQDKNGGFIDRDLYVYAFDRTGLIKAHGAKPVLIGKSVASMKDVTGFSFMQSMLDVKETGWVDYKWPDAADKDKIKDKSSYVVRVGNYLISVGYYKN
ncbi:MAG: cache domain-containing protein [Alphaproteobacteria bacterium]|nr:cache domain-containing protein [Alphaproteobacteria bacterium]